jgi:DNA-directed RNA polymerase subunit RPC12/RpoP
MQFNNCKTNTIGGYSMERVILCYHCGNKTLMKRVALFEQRMDQRIVTFNKRTSDKLDYSLYECPVCLKVTLELSGEALFDAPFSGDECRLRKC